MDLVSLLLHSEDKSIRIFCYKHRIGGFFNFTLTNYWAGCILCFTHFRSSDAALRHVYITMPSFPELISDLERNFLLHYSILSYHENN